MAPVRVLRIAVFNTDTPAPKLLSTYASYGKMFHDALARAAAKIGEAIIPTAQELLPNQTFVSIETDGRICDIPNIMKVVSKDFNVVKGEYPCRITDYDAIIISGSTSSSHDDEQWIRDLGHYLCKVYTKHPRIKMFGSCFGHQIICQSLLGNFGVKVAEDVNGWEVGVHEVEFTNEFRKAFRRTHGHKVPFSAKFQLVHAESVMIHSPHILPNGWELNGSTSHCAVQGLYKPGHILTFQGHFEFDRNTTRLSCAVFGASWNFDQKKRFLEAIEQDADNDLVAEMVLKFLLYQPSGVFTPPNTPPCD